MLGGLSEEPCQACDRDGGHDEYELPRDVHLLEHQRQHRDGEHRHEPQALLPGHGRAAKTWPGEALDNHWPVVPPW